AVFTLAFLKSARAEGDETYRFLGGERIQILLEPKEAGVIGEQVVSDEGRLSLPTGTTLNVKGKTQEEAKDLIATKMKKATSYKHIKVRIILLVAPTRNVYIAGSVRTPRSVPLTPGVPLYLMTLLQEGGGITDEGDPAKVNVVHTDSEGKRTSSEID